MQHDSGMEQAARLLGEKLVPHDQHRVRRRAPGIYLSRVIAETKRAATRAYQLTD